MRRGAAGHAAAGWAVVEHCDAAAFACQNVSGGDASDAGADDAHIGFEIIAQRRATKFFGGALPERDIVASSVACGFHANESRRRSCERVRVTFRLRTSHACATRMGRFDVRLSRSLYSAGETPAGRTGEDGPCSSNRVSCLSCSSLFFQRFFHTRAFLLANDGDAVLQEMRGAHQREMRESLREIAELPFRARIVFL